MPLYKFLSLTLLVLMLSACSPELTPEEKAQVEALKTELSQTKEQIADAMRVDAAYTGGMIKSLVAYRLEVLKINEALIQQRIHAIESGAKITLETKGFTPSPEGVTALEAEIAKQQDSVAAARIKASTYSGGLVAALANTTLATEENSLALLRQQYLVAKYGIPMLVAEGEKVEAPKSAPVPPPSSSTADSSQSLAFEIISVDLIRKEYQKDKYKDYIWMDMKFEAIGLDKNARAVKGALVFTDLFNEEKFILRLTLDRPIAPNETITETGRGFEYNQFKSEHNWILGTDISNMKVKFLVEHVLYEDGTTQTISAL